MRVSKEEWKKLRIQVFERDHYRCRAITPEGRVCLQGPPRTQIQCAHILARRKGGTDDIRNLITKCVDCHGREHPWMFKYAAKSAKNLVNVFKYINLKSTLKRAARRTATA